MAAIVLLTADTANYAATYVQGVLQGAPFNHTVTLLAEADVTSAASFNGYDLLVSVRGTQSNTTVHGYMRTAIDAGLPAIIGGVDTPMSNGGAYTSGTIVDLGITQRTRAYSTLATSYFLNVAHDILTGLTGLPATKSVYSSATIQASHDDLSGGTHAGTALAAVSSGSSTDRATIAIEAGENDVTGTPTPFGARVVMLSWLYASGSITFAADALTVLENAVNWALAAGATTFTSTGVLVGQGTALAGSAARSGTHTSTGVLAGQGSAIAGTANMEHSTKTTEGVLVGQGTALAGSASRVGVKTSTGVLVAQGSAVSGSASRSAVLAIDDDFEGSSANLSLSSIVGVGDDAVISVKPRYQIFEGIGSRWLKFYFRLTGVEGFRPTIHIQDYVSGSMHGFPYNSQKRCMASYDQETWFYIDTITLNTTDNRIELRHNTAFTGDVYIARDRQVNVTQMGNWLATMASSYAFFVPSPAAVSFTPVNTTGFPAQTFIADEYDQQTDDLGRTVPYTPLYMAMINDTSLMPTSGVKKIAAVLGGVHAGEDTGDWAKMRLGEWICGSDAEAQYIRRHWKIYWMPMLNASGRYGGGSRGVFGSGIGGATDSNRHANDVTPVLDINIKPRAVWLSDLDGDVPVWMFDMHGSYDQRFAMFENTGNTLHNEFRTRTAAIFTPLSGITVPDDGEIPSGAWSNYFEVTLGTPLAITIEHGDPAPTTEQNYLDWAPSMGGAIYSMAEEDLIENGDAENISGSGVLQGQGSALVATATHLTLHVSDGALVGQGSTVVGAASRPGMHASDGALVAQGSTLTGTALHLSVHIASGVLAGQGSTVNGDAGTVESTKTTTGVLVGPGSALSGSASHQVFDTNYSISIGSFNIRPLIDVDFVIKPVNPGDLTIEDYQ